MTKRKRTEHPKAYDLLVLPPQDKPVYFVVEREDNPEYNQEHQQVKFLYESHSCPTNWLKPVYMACGDDNDPHGLIRYIDTKNECDVPDDDIIGAGDRDSAFDDWVASTNGVIPDRIK